MGGVEGRREAEKRKKGRKANGNELFFSFTCLSLMVQIIACV